MKEARLTAGLTQQQAAGRLGVSQAYLAMLERGRRPVTARLAERMVTLYGMGPSALPIEAGGGNQWDSQSLAAALGRLGYPGFAHLRGGRKRNPALVLLAALSLSDVEVRVAEALPWLAAEYSDLNWEWLNGEAKLRDAQNRLGFVVMLGRRVAEMRGDEGAKERLWKVEEVLERARLVREDTLCQESIPEAERRWLRGARPAGARHWNLLTDLEAESLPYAV